MSALDYPPAPCRCRPRARASLRNLHRGLSIMGFDSGDGDRTPWNAQKTARPTAKRRARARVRTSRLRSSDGVRFYGMRGPPGAFGRVEWSLCGFVAPIPLINRYGPLNGGFPRTSYTVQTPSAECADADIRPPMQTFEQLKRAVIVDSRVRRAGPRGCHRALDEVTTDAVPVCNGCVRAC
jgi:hypothetical protein